MDQIRSALRDCNKRILELQSLGSNETKQTLTGLFNEKLRELEAHDKAKPIQVEKPETDPTKQGELQQVGRAIEAEQAIIVSLTTDLQAAENANRTAQLRKAVAERVLGRLRNFQLQYDSFARDAAADCEELGLKIEDLVKIQIDTVTPTSIRDEAQVAGETATVVKTAAENGLSAARQRIGELTSQLDAPNIKYQTYVQELEAWQQRRAVIVGNEAQVGSINYLQVQLSGLLNIPAELKVVGNDRE